MADRPFDVVGVGINSVDRVLVLPAFPTAAGAGSKMRVLQDSTVCGGQTATAMAACARFGLRSKYIGATGNGPDGRLVRDTLSRLGVDVSHVVAHDAVNRFAVILIDERDGQRAVLWDFDERLALTDSEIPPDALVSARVVHVDDVDERAAIHSARIARSAGVTVTSDIDQVTERTAELIEAVSVAIFAEHVPSVLAQRLGRWPSTAAVDGLADEALRDVLICLPRRPDQTFCVTLGRRGALALEHDRFHYAPGFDVRVADSTAAGDVFRAGFIYGLLRGWEMDERLRFANAAAAVSCTRLGAIPSVPSPGEVEELLTAGRR